MQRFSVMISSTVLDLPEHREQVRIACEQAGFAPHYMMEHLAGLNRDAIDASLQLVDEADVYLCVLAFRYGTIAPGADNSITEMEFNRALETNKPRLAFLINESEHPITCLLYTSPSPRDRG